MFIYHTRFTVPTRNTRIIHIGIYTVADRITTIVVIHPIVCVCGELRLWTFARFVYYNNCNYYSYNIILTFSAEIEFRAKFNYVYIYTSYYYYRRCNHI